MLGFVQCLACGLNRSIEVIRALNNSFQFFSGHTYCEVSRICEETKQLLAVVLRQEHADIAVFS